MFLKDLKKSEKGSITVFVLSTMLVVVGVILTYYFSMMNKSSSQAAQLEKIQEEYNKTNSMMNQIYEENKTFGPGVIADKNETYTDDNGDTATIPEGFEILEDADTVDDGLVIQDEQKNQFVWIPVETPVADTEADGTTNKAMAIKNGDNYRGLLYNFTSSGSTVRSGCTTTTSSYREPAYLTDSSYADESSYNQDEDGNKIVTEDGLQEEYNKMMASVEKYHGFYVGRYELGLEGTTPVSKNASTNSNVTTASAGSSSLKNWYGLYSKCKEFAEEESDKSVVSTMIWGSQYDAMMNWVQRQGGNIYAIGGGNSTRVTGSDENDILGNIFDLKRLSL